MSLTQQYDWNNCDTIQDVIFALCDDLDFAWDDSIDQAAFEAHVADCPECQAYRLDTETSIAGLRKLGNSVVIPDADLITERVLQKLNLETPVEATSDNVVVLKRKPHFKQWSSIAAAVTLLLISIPPLVNFPGSQQHSTQVATLSAPGLASTANSDSQLVASSIVDDHYLSPFNNDTFDNASEDPIKVLVGF